MESYKHSLNYYEQKLDDTRKKLALVKQELNYSLGSNVGNIITHYGNKSIMEYVNTIETLSYNEAFYEAVIKNIIKGRVKEGKE